MLTEFLRISRWAWRTVSRLAVGCWHREYAVEQEGASLYLRCLRCGRRSRGTA